MTTAMTIVSARYANPNHDAGFLVTAEIGEIMVDPSQSSLWDAFLAAAPAEFIYPAMERFCSQNQWNGALDASGKLEGWLALQTDVAVKAKDRAYMMSGGDTGKYAEGSAKLARLALKAGVDVSAMFDAALTE